MYSTADNDTQSRMNNSAPTIYIPVWLTGTVSPAMLAEFEYYSAHIALICSVIGAVCSLQNLVVYERRNRSTGGRREVHVSFLMAICVADGLYTLSTATIKTCSLLMPQTSKMNAYLNTILGIYTATSFRRTAIWLNALASLERFLTIAFPLGAASYVFKRAPVVVILSVFLVVCSAHAYVLFEFTAVDLGGGQWEQRVTQARLSDPALFESIKNLVRIVCFYTPLLASLVVNTLLMVALHRHARGMKGMLTSRGGNVQNTPSSSAVKVANKMKKANKADTKMSRSTETQAAKLILVLTLTFFFMALPSSVNATVTSFTPDYGFAKKEMFLFLVLFQIFDQIQVLTQAAITLVSVSYSRRFRDALTKMFCERCQRKKDEMKSAETNMFSVSSFKTRPDNCTSAL